MPRYRLNAAENLVFAPVVGIDLADRLTEDRDCLAIPVILIVLRSPGTERLVPTVTCSEKSACEVPRFIATFKTRHHPGRRVVPAIAGQAGHIVGRRVNR